jgi:hypothetical protein
VRLGQQRTTPEPGMAEIANLLARARQLSDTRHRHDHAQRAAHQAAKTDLLARLSATDPHREDQS